MLCSACLGGIIAGVPVVLTARLTVREQFPGRFRLEKEYETYSHLWSCWQRLYRSAGALVTSVRSSATVDHSPEFPTAFNAYQDAVILGKPFMAPLSAHQLRSFWNL